MRSNRTRKNANSRREDTDRDHVEANKFISKNEYKRVKETTRQTVERVGKIEEKLIREVLNHKDVGIRTEFNKVDNTTFRYEESDTNTKLKTSVASLTAAIKHTILKNGDVVYCKILTDGDPTINKLTYSLGFKCAKITYNMVQAVENSHFLIQQLHDQQVSLLQDYNEIDKTLLLEDGVKRHHKAILYVPDETIKLILLDEIDAIIKQSDLNVTVENIHFEIGSSSYRVLENHNMVMNEISVQFGSGSKTLQDVRNQLSSISIKKHEESRNAKNDALMLLRGYCTKELNWDIDLMLDEEPNISLKKIYDYVTSVNYDLANLWAEWSKTITNTKQNTLYQIQTVTSIDEFYATTSQGISRLESLLKECRTNTKPMHRQRLEEMINTSATEIFKFYQDCFYNVPTNNNFRHILYDQLQRGTSLFEPSLTVDTVIANSIFEEHVAQTVSHNVKLNNAIQERVLKTPTSYKPNRNDSKSDHPRPTVDTRTNTTKSPANSASKTAKSNQSNSQSSMVTQEQLDTARDQAYVEIGSRDYDAVYDRVAEKVAPLRIPQTVCFKCWKLNTTTNKCDRCRFKASKMVKFEQKAIFVTADDTPAVCYSINPTRNSTSKYQYKGKEIPLTENEPIYAREDTGCDYLILLSSEVDQSTVATLSQLDFPSPTLQHVEPYLSYKGVGNHTYKATHVNTIHDKLIIQGEMSDVSLMGTDTLVKLLSRYDPDVATSSLHGVWKLTFKGEVILQLVSDQHNHKWVDVHRLLLLLQYILKDQGLSGTIKSPTTDTCTHDEKTCNVTNINNTNTSLGGTSDSIMTSGCTSANNSSTAAELANSTTTATTTSQHVCNNDKIAKGTLRPDYQEIMDKYKPDIIDLGQNDDQDHSQWNEFFEEGYIPDLFFLKNGNGHHRAFITTKGDIGFLVIPSPAYPNLHHHHLKKSILQAQLMANFFGNPHINTIKSMLEAYPNLPFTMADYKEAKVVFGNIHEDIGNVKKKRGSRHGNISTQHRKAVPAKPSQRIDTSKTTLPGHTIHIDIKQVGGTTYTSATRTSSKLSILHGVDTVTNMTFAVEYSKNDFKNALLNLVATFNAASIDAKIPTSKVKIIRFDNDIIFSNNKIASYFRDQHDIKIELSLSNYSERKAEISIQHIDRVLSRLVVSYPFEPPAWLMLLLWIAICEILNFLVTYPNSASPSEKYRGYKTDITGINWLPVGSLVLVRREDRQLKQRDPQLSGQDSMVGRNRARVAILLGVKYDRHRYAREYLPITTNDFNKYSQTLRNYTTNPKALPHVLELFPRSLWQHQKVYDNFSKLYVIQQFALMNIHPELQASFCSVQNTPWVVDTENNDNSNNLNIKNNENGDNDSMDTSTKITEKLNRNHLVNVLNLTIGSDEQEIKNNFIISIRDSNFPKLLGSEFYQSKDETDAAVKYKKRLISDQNQEDYGLSNNQIKSYIIEKLHEEIVQDNELQEEFLNYYHEEQQTCQEVYISSNTMSYKQVLKQKDKELVKKGLEAINKERNNLLENKVIEFKKYSDIPIDKRNDILNTFLFVVNKYDGEGNFIKAKARCVAGGNEQSPNTYNRTSSPVVNRNIVFMVLQLLTEPDFRGYQLDISEAFCKVQLQDHEIFVRTDKAFHDGTENNKYAKLLKCLYGLKQAAFEFYVELKKVLAESGFSPTAYDGGLFFIKDQHGLHGIALVHVDDFLLLVKDDRIKDNLYEKLVKRFKKVTMEELSNFCGLSIKKNNNGCVHVNQQHYLATLGDNLGIEKLIEKCQQGHRWSLTPWDTSTASSLFSQSDIKVSVKQYQKLLGSILYAVNTRPDIQSMVTILSSKQLDPRQDDYEKLVRICWYLRKTSHLGLIFHPIERINGRIQLYGSADGSYENKNGGRGRTGITLSLGPNGTPFMCVSKRQNTRSRSSTEAEIKAWNHCAAITSYLINVLNVLGYEQDPVIIETDNKAASHATINPNITQGLAHLEPIFWYCRSLYQNRKVLFCYTHTDKLLADPLTKAILNKKKFDEFRIRLLGLSDNPHKNRQIILPNNDKILLKNEELNLKI